MKGDEEVQMGVVIQFPQAKQRLMGTSLAAATLRV